MPRQFNLRSPSGGATATQEAGGAPKTGVKYKIFRETGVDSLTATFYCWICDKIRRSKR